MRRHVKASFAGSTLGQASSLGSIDRGAFVTRGAFGNLKGSGAPAAKLTIALVSAIALLLALGASSASAAGSYSTSSSLCSAVGAGGDQCGEIKSVAVDTSTGSPTSGHVYLLDTGNFRVNQYNAAGTFVRAFGVDVIASGQHESVGAGAEVCEPANSTPVDVCKAGPSAGGTKGGAIAAAARGIAVDPVTHIVYVVTASSRLAYYNGTTGAYIGQSEGDASNSANAVPPPVNFGAPEKFILTTGVAIDSTTAGGPYLYISITTGSNPNFRTKIDKFQAAGAGGSPSPTYICQITGTATDTSVNHTECGNPNPGATNDNPLHKDGEFNFLLQGTNAGGGQEGGNLTVDANGNIYISESPATLGANQGRHVVSVFSKTGNFLKQFKPSGAGISATEPRPEALAILSSGNLALSAGAATGGAGGNRIQEYDPATIAAGPTTTIAVPRTEISLPSSGASRGLAGYGTALYVGDKTNKKALKYVQVPSAPDVTTDAATAISKFKATLHGTVNPAFATVTDCHFEYLTDTAYQANAPGTRFAGAATAPCTPAGLGSGNSPVAVSANLSGLQFGTEYHVRAVASNSVGTTPGNEVTFSTTSVNKPEAITTAGATAITQATAKVAGKVNPNEVQITDCHFKYITDAAFQANLPADRFAGATTAPCVPNAATIGAGGSLVDVSASLSALNADTTYHFLLKATNFDGTSENTDEKTFATLPAVPSVSEASSEAGQIAAKVTGKVNPNSGPNASPLTGCRIDYGTTPSYGQTQPCVPSATTIGAGSSPVAVSFALTGLSAGVPYYYRVIATNAGGSGEEAKTFLTLPPNPPTAFTDGSTAGPSDTFTLQGRVDPEGIALTDCHFAYGPTAEYGKTAPCIPSPAGIGSGDSPISVTAATEPLEPSTTYHFRLFASNVRGSSQGKDRILTSGGAPSDSCANAAIRAEQGIEVQYLPDCLALEQVSPSKKGNQGARLSVVGMSISRDGDSVLFNSIATLGNCTTANAIGGDNFIGTRTPSGWSTACTNPPANVATGQPTFSFSPDLSSWLQRTGNATVGYTFRHENASGLAAALSPALPVFGTTGTKFLGASADHSDVYLRVEGTESRNLSFLPGDPQPDGQDEDSNLYLARLDSGGAPSLQLAAKDKNDKVWGGNCGARLGGMEQTSGPNLNLTNGERNQGAISADGTRVYFSTRPSQPTNTTPGGPITGACTEANKRRIMLREETSAGVEIKELIASECNRATPDPACSATDGDDVYQGASIDQKLLYFTTTRQLDDADLDSNANSCDRTTAVSGCDLYLYDADKPEGERLIDVSAGESTATTPGIGASVRNSITAISPDGSHAYFVARTVLTTDLSPTEAVAQPNANNLYLYDHSSEDLSFLGTLANADAGALFGGQADLENDAYPVPLSATDSSGKEIGGDGHLLVFSSRTQLTSDDTDSSSDIYRYDSEADTLVRVSEAPGGGTDDGPFGVVLPDMVKPGTDYAERGRWVSEDGETIAFTSLEALFPGDTNGVEDSYLWRSGQLYHLPGSTRSSSRATEIRPIVSHDGDTVAYHSTKRLTFTDTDTVEDVYVLRPGGGFADTTVAECQGEACQGAPSTLSGEIGATTGSGGSAGNANPTAAKCPQGKRKVRRNGKARCIKSARHHKKKHASQKRTSSNRGGQK